MADTLFLFLAMAGDHRRAVDAAPVMAGLPRGRPAARPVRHRPVHRPAAARGARGLPGHRCLAFRGARCVAGARRRACALAFARAACRLRGLVRLGARRVRDDRLHRGLPVLAGDDVRRLLPDVAAGRPAAAVHVGAAEPAADRAGLHLDAGEPAAAAARADVLPDGQRARRAVRDQGHRGAAARLRAPPSGTTPCGRSRGTARSSPTRRPTTPTCSGTPQRTYRDSPFGGYPSPEAYYAHGNPATVDREPVRPAHPRLPALRLAAWHRVRADPAGRAVRDRAAVAPRGAGGAAALAVLAGADRRARGDGGVRLPVRDDRRAVRLPSRRDGVRLGGPRAPRRGRRP